MKGIYLIALIAALATYPAAIRAQQETVDTAVFSRIRKAELSASQIPMIAHYLTDVSGPRLTNSSGYKRAAAWAVAIMSKWGLKNAALEPWGTYGKQWELQDFSIIMRSPYTAQVRAYVSPWSPGTNRVKRGEVTVLNAQQYIDTNYIKQHFAEFMGKIVLITGQAINTESNFKPSATRLADTALANLKDNYMATRAELAGYGNNLKLYQAADGLLKKAGAIAFIGSRRQNVNGSVFVQGVYGYKLTDNPVLPQVTISLEDGQKIKRLTLSGHKVELELNIVTKFSTDDTKGYNVVAEIPGTDPKLKSQLVMLGGHLDSWQAATGATDNAAGCTVMMEAVRLLDSLGLKPKRTIRIALWDGEEEGLLGSYGYAQNHFMDPKTFALKPEQAKVSAYFNLDNGTGKIRGIYAQGNAGVKNIFESWLKPFSDLGASTVTAASTGSTDHLSFDWAGIPGFQFIQDEIDYESRTHHSNLDDYDHLQMADLKQAAIIVASFVYQASVRAAMLPRKPLVKNTFVFDGL